MPRQRGEGVVPTCAFVIVTTSVFPVKMIGTVIQEQTALFVCLAIPKGLIVALKLLITLVRPVAFAMALCPDALPANNLITTQPPIVQPVSLDLHWFMVIAFPKGPVIQGADAQASLVGFVQVAQTSIKQQNQTVPNANKTILSVQMGTARGLLLGVQRTASVMVS
jgi:hypothetical protein